MLWLCLLDFPPLGLLLLHSLSTVAVFRSALGPASPSHISSSPYPPRLQNKNPQKMQPQYLATGEPEGYLCGTPCAPSGSAPGVLDSSVTKQQYPTRQRLPTQSEQLGTRKGWGLEKPREYIPASREVLGCADDTPQCRSSSARKWGSQGGKQAQTWEAAMPCAPWSVGKKTS